MGGERPTVFTNPRDDAAFVGAIEGLLEHVDSPEALQEALRVMYPSAVVRRREISGEPGAVWYAYRDGRWTAPHDQGGIR